MLSDRLKELREESELSQDDIAKRLNVSRSTYSNYEIGRTEPSVSTLIDISKLYDVSIDFLCGNTNVREKFFDDPKLCKYINRCILIYKDFFKD